MCIKDTSNVLTIELHPLKRGHPSNLDTLICPKMYGIEKLYCIEYHCNNYSKKMCFIPHSANYGEIFPSDLVRCARNEVFEIERKLKAIGKAHQAERKRLVVAHASLSQGEDLAVKESHSLRSQLVSLSTRQKQLLQCFVKQKKISSKLGELEKQEMSARKAG